jgi:hypothetical protein
MIREKQLCLKCVLLISYIQNMHDDIGKRSNMQQIQFYI